MIGRSLDIVFYLLESLRVRGRLLDFMFSFILRLRVR